EFNKLYLLPFNGWMCQQFKCLNCNYTKIRRQISFNHITLNFNNNNNNNSVINLIDFPIDILQLLNEYQSDEIIYDYRCYKCELLYLKKCLEIILFEKQNNGYNNNINNNNNKLSNYELNVLFIQYKNTIHLLNQNYNESFNVPQNINIKQIPI